MLERQAHRSQTSNLFYKLFKAVSLKAFVDDNVQEMVVPQFHTYITELCREWGRVPEQVIKQAAIERTYGHQLFNGTRKPSRDKVIQLAFGLGLDVDHAQYLLKLAQKSALYPKIKRDAAILFCLIKHKSVIETQGMLQELGLPLLGGEEKNG